MEWKIPGRQVYTHNFKTWVKEFFWCYFVLKLWPDVIDLGSDPLRSVYLKNPAMFVDQYWWLINRVNGLKQELLPENDG